MFARIAKPQMLPFFYGWFIVATAFLVNFAQTPLVNPVLGVFIKPVSEELGGSRGLFSALVTLGFVLGAIGGPIAGAIIDRRGGREVVIITSAFAGAAMLCLAFVREFWQFALFYVLAKAAVSGTGQLAVTVAVSNWFVRMRGRAIGFTYVGFRTGQAVMPLVAYFFMVISGWRLSWVALALFLVFLSIVPTALFLQRRPEDLGLLPDGASAPDPAKPSPGKSPLPTKTEVSWNLKQAINTRAFWLLCLVSLQLNLPGTAINLHAVSYLDDMGIDRTAAVTAISLLLAIAAVATTGWGFLAERIPVRFCLMATLVVEALGVWLFSQVRDLPLLWLFTFVHGIGLAGGVALIAVTWADYFGRASLGAIRGATSLVQTAGVAAGPLIAGIVYDLSGSYQSAFSFFIVSNLVAGFLMLLATVPRQKTA